jgi:hypothetical protein
MLTTNCPTCGSKVGMTNNRGTNHFIVLDNESKDQQIKDLQELLVLADNLIMYSDTPPMATENYKAYKKSYKEKYPTK